LGFGVPVIAAGQIVVHTGDLSATTLGYAAVLIALAVIAAVGLFRARHSRSTP
jgi:hypothetical protein